MTNDDMLCAGISIGKGFCDICHPKHAGMSDITKKIDARMSREGMSWHEAMSVSLKEEGQDVAMFKSHTYPYLSVDVCIDHLIEIAERMV